MKKFKSKKYHHNSKLILFFIGIFLFLCIFIFLSLHKLNNSYHSVVSFLLKDLNPETRRYSLIKNLNYLVSKYSFDNDKYIITNKSKMVYLYNTHDTETYQDNTSIIETSKYLKENLKKIGIECIVENRKNSDYLMLGKKDYDISREFIKDIMTNQDISYFIDIQRDSISSKKITINNKDYAKISFVLGLDNPNYLKNLKVIEKMNNYLNDNYPGLSNGIYEYKGENDIYNQDLGENILLIKIGGIDNNKDEVNNSTEIIALTIYNLLGDRN